MRACEHVRMNLSYMQSNVKLVAIGSGVSMGYLGNSHFGLEDISIISSMPDIPAYQPSDCIELFDMVHVLLTLMALHIRLTGIAPSPIHSANYAFSPNKADVLSSGSQLLIISWSYPQCCISV